MTARTECPHCGSSDGVSSETEPGWLHCFACNKNWKEGDDMDVETVMPLMDMTFAAIKTRKLTEETCRRYRYGQTMHHGRPAQVAQFVDATGRIIARKLRYADKTFEIVGDGKAVGKTLWGANLARTAGKMIVITEGEIDAMSVSQGMGNTWPAVSLPNGAQNLKAIEENLEFLEGYDKVVIWFDDDEPGREATDKVVTMLSPGKAYIVDGGGFKDANEMLKAKGGQAVRQVVWEAKEYRPDGVVNLAEMKDRVLKELETGHLYPWSGLNSMLYGFRPKELITWTAGTGVGKTAIVSEIAYNLAIKQGMTVGLIYLEEGIERAGRRLMGIHLDKPLHLPNGKATAEELSTAFDATLGTERVFAYDHFGSLDADVLLNRVRYMVKGLGCQVVILDHISMVVSGADLDADERRTLDRIMTLLRSLTQETGATIHVVSHLRRPSGSGSHEEGLHVSLSHLRGTQAIAQLSDAVIAAERNQQHEDREERNVTLLRVLKNRYAGVTGPADRLRYNAETGRLEWLGLENTQPVQMEDF